MQSPHSPRYGHRHEIVHNVQGSPFNQDTPLRAEDFLDPRPGDVFYHGKVHDAALAHLEKSLRHFCRRNTSISILTQAKLVLPAPARYHPLPDLMLVRNMPNHTHPRAIFNIEHEQTTPVCIIEITSPLFYAYDLREKAALYAQAGIGEYIVLDTGLRPDQDKIQPQIFVFGHDSLATVSHSQGAAHPSGAQEVQLQALNLRIACIAPLDAGAEAPFVLIDGATGTPVNPDIEDQDSLSSTQAEGKFRAASIASQLKF